MDGNANQNYLSSANTADFISGVGVGSSDAMPPLAPSFKHSQARMEAENNQVYHLDQQTLDRLMDSVYKSRMENGALAQHAFGIEVEDVYIKNGAIEIRARIIPEPAIYSDDNNSTGYLNHSPSYEQPAYKYPTQLPNQLTHQPLYQLSSPSPNQPYQVPYQTLTQPAYISPYQSQYQPLNQITYQPLYPYPNQLPNQVIYPNPYQSQYTYLNQTISPQYLPQTAYRYSYANQFSNPYFYQYPMAGLAGSIANAVSQLALMSSLLKR